MNDGCPEVIHLMQKVFAGVPEASLGGEAQRRSFLEYPYRKGRKKLVAEVKMVGGALVGGAIIVIVVVALEVTWQCWQ